MEFRLESLDLPPYEAITDWEVVRMSRESMTVQLEFLDPLLVSASQA